MNNLAEQTSEHKPDEFLAGDMVVIPNSDFTELFDVFGFYYGEPMRLMVRSSEGKEFALPHYCFRHATVAENQLKRRLTAEELARAEVS